VPLQDRPAYIPGPRYGFHSDLCLSPTENTLQGYLDRRRVEDIPESPVPPTSTPTREPPATK
jgi:hypothetical protein